MTQSEYNNLRPGDRISVVVEHRERIMRITHWQNGVACGNLRRLRGVGWCGGVYKAEPYQVCEQTYSTQQRQTHISDYIGGGAA
jgi:hypothetical protein